MIAKKATTSTRKSKASPASVSPVADNTVKVSAAPIAGVTAPIALGAIPAPTAPSDADLTAPVPTMKLRNLVDQVVETTGIKRKTVKDVIVATLAGLGAALTKGEELNLPPLGKAKISRQRDLPTGEIIVVKLRRNGAGEGLENSGKDTLAATDD